MARSISSIIFCLLVSLLTVDVSLAQITVVTKEGPSGPEGTIIKPTSKDTSFVGSPFMWEIVNGVVATFLIVSGLTVGLYHFYVTRYYDKLKVSQEFPMATPQSRFTDYTPNWYSYPIPQSGFYDDVSFNSNFGDPTPLTPKLTEVEEVARGNFIFTGNLYRALNSENRDNSIFSPWSVSTLMAIIKLGAGGQTAYEIGSGLSLPFDDQVLTNGFSKVTQSLKVTTQGNHTLTSANGLYAQKNFELEPNFEKSVREKFGAEIRQVNFVDGVSAANEINDWVLDSTKGRIQGLISPDFLGDTTRLILVNGIYFKGFWKSPFDPQFTRKMGFYINDRHTLPVDMMVQQNAMLKFKFLPQIDAHVVLLPYEGERLSLILFIPREPTGLARVENGLGGTSLFKILRDMPAAAEQMADIYLPKFKIEATMNLMEPLKKLGIHSMFIPGSANFTGISITADLYVSQVIQKAFIEVNEEGTEAAGATGFTFYRSIPLPVPKIIADRPFAFHVWDHETNFVLFGGRVMKPYS